MSPNGDFDSVTTTSEEPRTGRLYSMDTISSVRSRQETPSRMSIGRKNVPTTTPVMMQQQQQNIHHSESAMKRNTVMFLRIEFMKKVGGVINIKDFFLYSCKNESFSSPFLSTEYLDNSRVQNRKLIIYIILCIT